MEAAASPAPPTARCCYSCTLTLQLTLCIRCGKSYHHLCAGAEGNDDMNVCGRCDASEDAPPPRDAERDGGAIKDAEPEVLASTARSR
jgi:hypothetical protein